MIMALSGNHQLLQGVEERLSPGLEVWQRPLGLSALGDDGVDAGKSFFVLFNKEVFYAILDYLRSDGALTSEHTALHINSLLPTGSISEEDGYGMSIDFSRIWSEISLELPHDHIYQERIISLLKAFQAIPESVAVSQFAFDGPDWFSLRDKAVITNSFYDRYTRDVNSHGNDPDGIYMNRDKAAQGPIEPPLQIDESQVDKWVNLQALSARIVTAKIDLPSFENYFIWTFRNGAMEEPCYDIDLLNCDIRATAMWILYVGDTYRSLIPDGEPDGYVKRAQKGGHLFTGGPGFTIERWLFWKKRYLDLLDQFGDKLSEEATTAAKAAIAKISETEKAWDLDKH